MAPGAWRQAPACNFDPNPETREDDDEAFHDYLKTLPKAEAQTQYQARITRQYEKQRRLVNDIFQFWIVCQDGACKRIEACAGNPHACFARWWRVTPERHKAYFRAYVRASADGGAHEDAHRYAQAEVKRLAEHIAWVEAEQLKRLDALEAAERAKAADADTTPAQRENAATPARPPREARPRVRLL